MTELRLDHITRIDRVWLDDKHTFKRKPPQGGSWRYFRIVVDGTCNGCERHADLGGGRHREYLRLAFPMKTDAERHVLALSADAYRGLIEISDNTTTAEWLRVWRDEYLGRVSERTRESYVQIVDQHLIPGLGHVPLSELDDKAINAFYRAQTAKGLSSSTVNKHHTILSMALGVATKKKRLRRNPADSSTNDIVLPSRTGPDAKRKHRALSDSDMDLLLQTVEGDELLEVPIALALLAGLRAQEVLALRWSDVDFDRRMIRIEQALEQTRGENGEPVLRFKAPKSDKGRRGIPLSDDLAAILTRWRSSRSEKGLAYTADSALVFPSNAPDATPQTPLARTALSNRWVKWKYLKEHKAIFGDVTYHDLRHTAASFWLRHGIPLFRVSRWLGHANIAITADTYGHEAPDEADAEELSALHAGIRKARGAVVELPKKNANG